MFQGLLTEQAQVTSYQDQQAHQFLHPLYEIHDAGQHGAASTFRMRLLGDFVMLLNDTPVSGLDMLRLQALLAYLALHHHLPGWRPF